ncbi:hypothetical protein KAU19_04150 [Candidatus Parcubacteria bacterium]|nr:hypothetical protein [Candidatus Parcubacteria bacterium]
MALITIKEMQRRIKVFIKVLPNNPSDSKAWTHEEVCRVLLNSSHKGFYNPSSMTDKIDIHHDLRRQHYNDIKLAANLKAFELKQQREQRQSVLALR